MYNSISDSWNSCGHQWMTDSYHFQVERSFFYWRVVCLYLSIFERANFCVKYWGRLNIRYITSRYGTKKWSRGGGQLEIKEKLFKFTFSTCPKAQHYCVNHVEHCQVVLAKTIFYYEERRILHLLLYCRMNSWNLLLF